MRSCRVSQPVNKKFMRLPKIILSEQAYFITTNVFDRAWVFVDRKTKEPSRDQCDIFVRNLMFYRRVYQFRLWGFVIMLDHAHILLRMGKHGNICDALRDIKRRSSFEIHAIFGGDGPLWQSNFYEHSIRDEHDLEEKLNYIHVNPVRAGLSENPEGWRYSSACWYAGLPSVIKIDSFG